MLSEIGDTELTAEAVSGFLQGLGFDTKPVSDGGQETETSHQHLAEVTELASRVSAAANNSSVDAVSKRIAEAQSVQEIEAIMHEVGAVQS